jgi:hypothetical protein
MLPHHATAPQSPAPTNAARRIGVGIDTSRYGHYAAFLRDDWTSSSPRHVLRSGHPRGAVRGTRPRHARRLVRWTQPVARRREPVGIGDVVTCAERGRVPLAACPTPSRRARRAGLDADAEMHSVLGNVTMSGLDADAETDAELRRVARAGLSAGCILWRVGSARP